MRIALSILILLLAAACGWLARAPEVVYEIEVRTDTVTTVEIQTVYEPVTVTEEIVVRDTIIKWRDRDIQTEVAQLETVFTVGSKLDVRYYIAPRVFEIQYEPAPVEIRTVTITNEITAPREWWDRPGLIAFSAFVLGVAL